MPTPTIGRRVWVWNASDLVSLDPLQPFDAGIIYVHNAAASVVTLQVTDHTGGVRTYASVRLIPPDQGPGRHRDGEELVATWMPYQMK